MNEPSGSSLQSLKPLKEIKDSKGAAEYDQQRLQAAQQPPGPTGPRESAFAQIVRQADTVGAGPKPGVTDALDAVLVNMNTLAEVVGQLENTLGPILGPQLTAEKGDDAGLDDPRLSEVARRALALNEALAQQISRLRSLRSRVSI